jgi:hypothetical protein
MPHSRQSLRARVSQSTGRRRKKSTNPVERAFDGVRQLVSDTGDRVLGWAGQAKGKSSPTSAKKAAATRKLGGRQRQTDAKKLGATRVRSGRQRQAAAKKAVRTRRAKLRRRRQAPPNGPTS